MADHPDIYADNIVVSANNFGLTLTLQRSEPGVEAGPDTPELIIVGRVRMSHELARTMSEIIGQTLLHAAQAAQAGQQAGTDKKH